VSDDAMVRARECVAERADVRRGNRPAPKVLEVLFHSREGRSERFAVLFSDFLEAFRDTARKKLYGQTHWVPGD
jgi:hypothetical protein